MPRTIRHFSLHRIANTELRVVADVEDCGVLPFIQIEENVIRRYIQQSNWPHHWVMLYILDDFQPLMRQLHSGANKPTLSAGSNNSGYHLTPERAAILNDRPLVNLYDLSNLTGCNVFVNCHVMMATGYWQDHLTIEALLAHEHAHPLAENEATRAARRLQVKIAEAAIHPANLLAVLTALVENLCILAPRELFSNQTTLQNGFVEALFHLNHINVTNTARGIENRKILLQHLEKEVSAGKLTAQQADLLILGGDWSVHLPLAMEIAPFYRAGLHQEAQELEAILNQIVFPNLDPLTAQVYQKIRDAYIDLQPVESSILGWTEGVLDILKSGLAQKGMSLEYQLQMDAQG